MEYSANAVKIHLWVAIWAYILVAYIKSELKSNYCIYEIMQILSVSALDKTSIRDLLCEKGLSNQNVKEQLKLFDLQ